MSSETISLIAGGAVAVISIIYNIVMLVIKKKQQAKLTGENEEITKKNTLMEIWENLPEYISQAEQIFSQSGSGTAKKLFVENLVQIECIKNGVEFDKVTTSNKIEEILNTPQKKEVTEWQKKKQESLSNWCIQKQVQIKSSLSKQSTKWRMKENEKVSSKSKIQKLLQKFLCRRIWKSIWPFKMGREIRSKKSRIYNSKTKNQQRNYKKNGTTNTTNTAKNLKGDNRMNEKNKTKKTYLADIVRKIYGIESINELTEKQQNDLLKVLKGEQKNGK